jgi:hypothetical protein
MEDCPAKRAVEVLTRRCESLVVLSASLAERVALFAYTIVVVRRVQLWNDELDVLLRLMKRDD